MRILNPQEKNKIFFSLLLGVEGGWGLGVGRGRGYFRQRCFVYVLTVCSVEVIAINHCHHDCRCHSISPFLLSTSACDKARVIRKNPKRNRQRTVETEQNCRVCRYCIQNDLFSPENHLDAQILIISYMRGPARPTRMIGRYRPVISQLYISQSVVQLLVSTWQMIAL